MGLSLVFATAISALEKKSLIDFSQSETVKQIKGNSGNTQFALKDNVLNVTLPAGKGYPGVIITPKNGNWDLSKFDYVDAKIKNTGSENIRIAVRVDNPGDWKKEPYNTELLNIPPGREGIVRVKFGFSYGAPGYKLDPAKINQIMVFLGDPKEETKYQVISLIAGQLDKNVKFPDKTGALLKLGADFDTVSVNKNGATVSNSGTKNAPALKVTTFAKSWWPGVNISAPGGAWNLSDYEFIAIDIHNVDNHDIDVFVRVDNPGADGHKNCMTERIGTQPDQRVTMSIPIKRINKTDIKLFAMQGYPQGLYAKGGIDPANIIALTFFTGNTPVDNNFEISNIRAFGKYKPSKWEKMSKEEFFPFIDKFGQFMHKDWPGKIKSDEDLVKSRDEEQKQLAADPGPKNWNKWGGDADGPKLKATGHFRTEKYNNKWWLVDPDGNLFFSTGLCCVTFNYAITPIEDRESWFNDLPAKDSPLGKYFFKHWKVYGFHYNGREPLAYDFSSANLQRKYGEDWKKTFFETLHKRLKSWGINTIANWSNGDIYGMKKTPYTATFWYNSPQLKNGKVKFPDVFDPKFATTIDQRVREWLKSSHDDPWCIGFFIDNEMHWGGDDSLGRNTLASPASQAAKQKLTSWLKERYPDIADFNKSWNTSFSDWEKFAAATDSKPSTATAFKDLVDFTGITAEVYFKTIRDIIKKYAPNKLYLGCRCVGGSKNVMAASVKYCDVVSYNRYCASVRDIRLPENFDAPVIIGEFHFGAYDRGPFWGGLFTAESQQDRAKKLKEYVLSALDNPQIVGVHWFQYGDEATTGRAMDGENAQCGFVDICDTPYKETVEASREMGDTMYEYRLKK